LEVVIIILALVFSVWSELKKKKEEDADINFTEMTTLDDFFRQSAKNPDKELDLAGLTGKNRSKKTPSKKGKPAAQPVSSAARPVPKQPRAEVNYDNMPSLESAGYEASSRRPEVNYDELPSLTGHSAEVSARDFESTNYDQLPTVSARQNYESGQSDAQSAFSAANSSQSTDWSDSSNRSRPFSISRDDMLKSLILAEVMQRYNINRIYDRIPGVKSDN